MLLASDLVGLTFAFFTAELIYEHRAASGAFSATGEFLLFGLSLPLWVLAAKLYGLYDRDEERVDHSTADEILGVFHLVTVGTWVLYAFAYLTHVAYPQVPKLIAFWIIASVGIPVLRAAARAASRQTEQYTQNTLIVGSDDVAQEIARKLLKHPEYGIDLLGFVDSTIGLPEPVLGNLSVVGDICDLPELIERLGIGRVIVAFPDHDRDEIVDAARALNDLDVQVDIVPRFFDMLSPSVDMHSVEGVPLIGVRPQHLSRSSAFVKRSFDVIGATAGLVILSPLLITAALAVKLDSSGPIFFRQLRMGGGDTPFRILKLRTMVADAESRKPALAHLNKHNGHDPRMFKIDDDPRTTRVGSFLRRYSLDELPQLWNVLRGEMSLVGPRPLILEEDRFVSQWRRRRLTLKPGITGLWQVLGRDSISFEDMVRLDYVYVTSWSLGGDLRLLLRTIPVVFRNARLRSASLPAPAPLRPLG
jgi:exopolysaccharide biosynthesis polyprenyl glycosylphosphotransferase